MGPLERKDEKETADTFFILYFGRRVGSGGECGHTNLITFFY